MLKLVLAGALATATAITGLTAASAATARATPGCTASHLRPSFGGSQGAAGTLQNTWRLTNVGGSTCRVSGFPTLNNYRSDGRPLHTTVAHVGAAHAVVLRVGQHASFAVRFTDPGVLNCTPQPAAMLTIQVPGTPRPVITHRGVKACQGALRETALVKGG